MKIEQNEESTLSDRKGLIFEVPVRYNFIASFALACFAAMTESRGASNSHALVLDVQKTRQTSVT
jgi:hypothetical protein